MIVTRGLGRGRYGAIVALGLSSFLGGAGALVWDIGNTWTIEPWAAVTTLELPHVQIDYTPLLPCVTFSSLTPNLEPSAVSLYYGGGPCILKSANAWTKLDIAP